MMPKQKRDLLLLIIILAFAGLIYLVAWSGAPYIVQDSHDYIRVAVDLQDGRPEELHDRTPGYPLLLLLTNSVSTSEPSRALFWVQLLLHLVSVFLLTLFLNRISVSRVLIAAFLLLSLIPPNVVRTAYVLTETLTEFLLVVGAVLVYFGLEKGISKIRSLLLLISGVAFGLSALVRPTYQLLFIVICGLLLILLLSSRTEKRKWLFAIVSTFTLSTIIIGGYFGYNSKNFNFSGLTPLSGFNLSTRTVRVIERLPDEYEEIREVLIENRDNDLIARDSSHTGVMYIWQTIPELVEITGLEKPELSHYMLRLNLLLIQKAPLEYLVEVTRAMSTYWFPSSTELSNFDSRLLQLFWTIIHFTVIQSFFIIVFLLLGFALLMRFLPLELRKKLIPTFAANNSLFPLAFLLPLLIVVYTMLISTLMEVGNPRYRTPTDLFVFCFLILGVHFIIQFKNQAGVVKL